MSDFVIENIRLKELILVVNMNKPFFDEFIAFLNKHGYSDILGFISEPDDKKLSKTLNAFFDNNFSSCLYDGIARPYDKDKSKWFFITWLLRDAPTQRLQPMIASQPGSNTKEKRISTLIRLIQYIAPLLQDRKQWEWQAIAEVMLQRLEGSRRSLKGGLFEAIVRSMLIELFEQNSLKLTVIPVEVKLNDETYDVQIIGNNGSILIPVKTRETMGGGHALLFTRDIHKAISVARANKFECIPIVIAESWGGKFTGLECDNYIYISQNPNQLDKITPILKAELQKLIHIFSVIQ